MKAKKELAALCDTVLLANMADSFKAAIDRLLERGLSSRAVLDYVRAKARGHHLVIRQVEAYLESKGRSA